MPRDEDAVGLSVRALSLWRQLALAYDDIAIALKRPESSELCSLAQRIVEIEEDLRPLVVRIAALRAEIDPDPALGAMWRETDALIESLARRHPALVRTATAARDEAAAALARSRVARTQSASYQLQLRRWEPSFTSRRV
jgi:hypothetical protein